MPTFIQMYSSSEAELSKSLGHTKHRDHPTRDPFTKGTLNAKYLVKINLYRPKYKRRNLRKMNNLKIEDRRISENKQLMHRSIYLLL